jgi:hypothetical protein
MRAKIKDDYRWKTARACGGAEFVKSEYRSVPVGREDEALACELLEIEPQEETGETTQPAEPKPERGRKKGG